MEKQTNPTLEHIRLVLFAFGLIMLLLAFLALVFGLQVGYKNAFWVCGALAAIVVAVFILILLINLVWIGFPQIVFPPETKKSKRKRQSV